MANKAISELPQAQNVNNQDLFVLEQSGIAKKLTAETFITEQGIIDALAEALDGLPPVKMHCSNLAQEAIHSAIADYYNKKGIDPTGIVGCNGDCACCHGHHESEED